MRILSHPRAQRYVDDPSFWLHDRRPGVTEVRLYDVARVNGHLVIQWRESPERVVSG